MPSILTRRGIFGLLSIILIFSAVRVVHAQPTGVTLQADNITDTSAWLNGVVIPNGQNIAWKFQYGEGEYVKWKHSPTYCPQEPGILLGNVPQSPVNCKVTGLKPSTVYTFNLLVYLAPATPQSGNYGDSVFLQFTTKPSTPTLQLTDWALSNPSLSPAAPKVGESITFRVRVTALSTTQPYPQVVDLCPTLNGWSLHGNVQGDTISYTGSPVQAQIQYTATTILGRDVLKVGENKIEWDADCTNQYNDLNRSNNKASLIFYVTATPSFDFSLTLSPATVSVKPSGTANYKMLLTYSDPSYSGTVIDIQLTGIGSGMNWQTTPAGDLFIATSLNTPAGTYVLTLTGSAKGVTRQTSGTLTVTPEQTTTQSSTQTVIQITTQTAVSTPTATIFQTVIQNRTGAGPLLTIQQNDLLTIGLMGTVLILIAVLVLRRPKHTSYPAAAKLSAPSRSTSGFCINCGAQLKAEAKFCRKCGSSTE